jgi:putative component of membrane protein insertase Oxa1/YidC/SpoIIIJ protein YidD
VETLMPWGREDAHEDLYCPGCGTIATEFMQRRQLIGGALLPTPRIRVCVPCYGHGWRLVGPGIEEGTFYSRQFQRVGRSYAREGKTEVRA